MILNRIYGSVFECVSTEDWKKEGGRLVIKIGRERGWKTDKKKLIVFYRKIGRNGRGGWRETKDCVCEKNGRKVEENKDRNKRRTQRKLYEV